MGNEERCRATGHQGIRKSGNGVKGLYSFHYAEVFERNGAIIQANVR
jgi:hypothetical protein